MSKEHFKSDEGYYYTGDEYRISLISFPLLHARARLILKINLALQIVPTWFYTATHIAGNEDDLDDSDHLSSWSVLMHCTALYVPSICAVQRHQSCALRWRVCDWSTQRTRFKLIKPALILFPPSYCTQWQVRSEINSTLGK